MEGFGVQAQRKGAKAVIASLWPVADQSTGMLIREFYRIRQSAPSLTKTEALRRAQLGLLRGEGAPGKKGAPFRHPFYWAPFFLMGNWL